MHTQAFRGLLIAVLALLLGAGGGTYWMTPTYAQWWNPFAPRDYEDCAENAAREAKSKEALSIFLHSCDVNFAGRRKRGGGYTYYDNRQQRAFDIAGPNPTPHEMEYIDSQYSVQIERERQSEQFKAELEGRRQNVVSRLQVVPLNIECIASNYCGMYKLSVRLRNNSSELITAVSVGWAFVSGGDATCPTSLPTKVTRSVNLRKGDTTVLNIDGHDGPMEGNARYCIIATDVDIAR